MPRKAETVGGISPEYDNTNVYKALYLPVGYIKYLERLRASSDGRFSSLAHMIKFALGQTFPTPDNPHEEDEFVKKVFEIELNEAVIEAAGITFNGKSRSFKAPVEFKPPELGDKNEEELLGVYEAGSGTAKLYSGRVIKTDKGKRIRLELYRNNSQIFAHEFVQKDYDPSLSGRESFARGLSASMANNQVIKTSEEINDAYELFDELLVMI